MTNFMCYQYWTTIMKKVNDSVDEACLRNIKGNKFNLSVVVIMETVTVDCTTPSWSHTLSKIANVLSEQGEGFDMGHYSVEPFIFLK